MVESQYRIRCCIWEKGYYTLSMQADPDQMISPEREEIQEENSHDSTPEREEIQEDRSQDSIIDLYLKPGAPKVVRVTAPPGTGKTTTIYRLLKKMFLDAEQPLYPNFLVLTFTKRTRGDLIRKILNLQGSNFEKKNYMLDRIRSFHSLACGILQWQSIIDPENEKEWFDVLANEVQWGGQFTKEKDYLKKLAWKVYHRILAESFTIEKKEKQLQTLREDHRKTPAYVLVNKMLDAMETKFTSDMALTYDFSLPKAVEAIERGRPCSKINLDNVDLIIIDQFQDSNLVQIGMIESLMKRSSRDVKLLMIGDFDQNIYLWRGAKFRAVQEFISKFDWVAMSLNKTYRLGKSIKNISQQLIVSDPHYKELRIQYHHQQDLEAMNTKRDHPIVVKQFASQYSEVRWVVEKIYEHLGNGFKPRDITILLRQFKLTLFYKKLKLQLERKAKQLGKDPVPYDYQNSGDSLGSKEALYLLAWLKYFYQVEKEKRPKANQQDIIRILQLKHVGKKDEVWNKMKNQQIIDQRLVKYNKKETNRELSWRQFFIDFQKIRKVSLSQMSLREAIMEISSILGEASWLKTIKLNKTKVFELIEAIEEIATSIDRDQFQKDPIMSVVKRLISEEGEEEQKVEAVVEENGKVQTKKKRKRANPRRRRDEALIKELEIKSKRNRMQIQTIHSAKGLEYPIVFICGLDYGYYQSDYEENACAVERNISDAQLQRIERAQRDEIIEKQSEQLRLIYTAITRTSGFLYVFASKGDNYNASRPMYQRLPEHRIFRVLKQICNVTEVEPFIEERDGQTKKYIEQHK